ncbi:uncharacterized protein LACBIDRAFT_315672 [Laccaria bicolor S238N-H82]|uniref:Predicted protein n=1 Tax=Laccaria bicolor (strain S238N-H82 / ATCC MYA-4686) TaxID=486041 RepID=B0D2W6_LACBS|nr:uncharacterized protein LACBIDRAFT_315672 [Laccaria bicolor S238N-H82]EDR11164.1 predicted protein [Laccaria bicolor S238N-H82]|eukprot:XP_001878465.1 predicted protein [Laccaria bicolor S238N-H82]
MLSLHCTLCYLKKRENHEGSFPYLAGNIHNIFLTLPTEHSEIHLNDCCDGN